MFFCSLATSKRLYLYIRNFEQAEARRGEFAPGRPFKVKVQHGDVIAVCAVEEWPYFLRAKVDCTRLSREDCFEHVKSFCRSAKDMDVKFMAIVESDQLIGKEGELAGAEKESRASAKKRKERGEGGKERRSKQAKKELGRRQGRGGMKNAGGDQDQLQGHKWEDKNKAG